MNEKEANNKTNREEEEVFLLGESLWKSGMRRMWGKSPIYIGEHTKIKKLMTLWFQLSNKNIFLKENGKKYWWNIEEKFA